MGRSFLAHRVLQVPGAQAGDLPQPQLSLRSRAQSFCAQIILNPHPACRTKAAPKVGDPGWGWQVLPDCSEEQQEQKVLWEILVWLCKIPA